MLVEKLGPTRIEHFINNLLLAAKKSNSYESVNITFGEGDTLKDIHRIVIDIDGIAIVQIIPPASYEKVYYSHNPDGHPKSPTHGHFKIPHLYSFKM